MAKFEHEDYDKLPETHWSRIDRAIGPDKVAAQEALELLLKSYWRPMVRHLMYRFGCSQEEAEDFTQGFVKAKILESNLLEKANQDRGKFRNFLLTSLNNFVYDRLRKKKRQPKMVPLEDMPAVEQKAIVFDQEWAQAVIVNALNGMRAECVRKDQRTIWKIFFRRIVQPLVKPESNGNSFDELASECGLNGPTAARNTLQTGRKKFQKHLRNVVREYVGEGEKIDSEMRDLRRVLQDPTLRNISWDFDQDSSLMQADLETSTDLWSSVSHADGASLSALLTISQDPPANGQGEDDRTERMDREIDSSVGALIVDHADRVPRLKSLTLDMDQLAALTVEQALVGLDSEVDTLIALKVIYRHQSRPNDDSASTSVAKVLYLAAIAAAHCNRGVWISKLSRQDTARKMARAAELNWVRGRVSDLLRKAARTSDAES